jgi:hypothetical protein
MPGGWGFFPCCEVTKKPKTLLPWRPWNPGVKRLQFLVCGGVFVCVCIGRSASQLPLALSSPQIGHAASERSGEGGPWVLQLPWKQPIFRSAAVSGVERLYLAEA